MTLHYTYPSQSLVATATPTRMAVSGPYKTLFLPLPDGRLDVRLFVGREPSIFRHVPFASEGEAAAWVSRCCYPVPLVTP